MAERLRFLAAGDEALLVELADLAATLALLNEIRGARLEGVIDLIPAARTLMVRFDPRQVSREALMAAVAGFDLSAPSVRNGKVIEIPVVYDGADLEEVGSMLGCTTQDVIRRHTRATYTAAFAGFAPGFVYLTGDGPGIEVPRRKSPRVRVPAGSVAIGGKFCGVYPLDSPGGWQLLGHTSLGMWDSERPRPSLIAPGDRVRFIEVVKHTPASVDKEIKQRTRAATVLTVTRADRPALYQDLGRIGHADQGVGESGALDRASLMEANICVGNPPDVAALEITFGGFALTADQLVTLAVTGAPTPLAVYSPGGQKHWAPFGRPFKLEAGDELVFEPPSSGTRSYLALRGGFQVDGVLGSSSTDTLGKIGPAPVREGDILVPASLSCAPIEAARPPPKRLPKMGETITLDVVLGPRTDWFTEKGVATLFGQEWKVTPESSRVGMRLSGPEPLERRDEAELPSEGTALGSIQVPHNGQPVLLLADHPLTGGYPVIGVVARHHLDLAGQIPIGAKIRFNLVAGFAPVVVD